MALTVRLARQHGLAVRVWLKPAQRAARALGLRVVDHPFLDSFAIDVDSKPEHYLQLLRHLPAGLTEWAVHPAVDTETPLGVNLGWRVRSLRPRLPHVQGGPPHARRRGHRRDRLPPPAAGVAASRPTRSTGSGNCCLSFQRVPRRIGQGRPPDRTRASADPTTTPGSAGRRALSIAESHFWQGVDPKRGAHGTGEWHRRRTPQDMGDDVSPVRSPPHQSHSIREAS